MPNNKLEARGHFLFSRTFPAPEGAKTREQLSLLFSIGERQGNLTFMKHFWFDERLALNDFEALSTAKDKVMIITLAQALPFDSRDVDRAYGNLNDVIPNETSEGKLALVTGDRGSTRLTAVLQVRTRKGNRLLVFSMTRHFDFKTDAGREVPGVVYSSRMGWSFGKDDWNLHVTSDPLELPFYLNPSLPKGVKLNPPAP